LVVPGTADIRLSSTRAELDALPDAEEAQFLPGSDGRWGYGQDQVLSWAYYRLGGSPYGLADVGTSAGMGMGMPGPQVATTDRVPIGEVEVRRGDHVAATDGVIGRVGGLVVKRGDNCVTHVLLDEGHLWGQKRVAVPMNAVTDVEDGVRLNLTKDEVRDLPAVDLDEL
jgi:hypothetical protein